MSRFGIRKKLRAMIDGTGSKEIVQYAVSYTLPDGKVQVVQAEEGYSLLMASQDLPSPISTGRRAGGTCPDGGCGECRVHVIDGTGLSVMTDFERNVLDAHAKGLEHEGRARKPGPPIAADERLGCHTKIRGAGAKVRVKALLDYDSIRGAANDGA
jgi:ferredoxin